MKSGRFNYLVVKHQYMNRIRMGLLGILLLSSSVSFSQTFWPSTLLWRISGKGLTKPSYLYGTMHLQDRRLFDFGDSLYHSLETTEGLALEVNFNDFVDSVFSRKIDAQTNDDIKIDVKDSVSIKRQKLSRKDLKRIRDYRMSRMVKKGDMPTIVDGYLYGLALRQGKWTGGIEDVNDQLNVLNAMGAEMTDEDVLQPETNMREMMDMMTKIYLEQNLNAIEAVFLRKDMKTIRDRLLIQRNLKMARRMDSLTKIRTMFFAVGAAHLPGDSGVISILRRQGFQVDPVFSTTKIPGEEYAKKLSSIPWTEVEAGDQLYTVSMPGQPSVHSVFGEAMKMKVFFDLTTMTTYMTGQTIGSMHTQKDADKIFESVASSMGADIRDAKKKTIVRDGLNGFSCEYPVKAGTYRLELLQKDHTLFMLLMGSPSKEQVSSADANNFFNSFHARDIVAQDNAWQNLSLTSKGVQVRMPGMAKRNKGLEKTPAGSSWNITTYDFADNRTGLYYIFQVRDTKPGYSLTSDSTYFEQIRTDFVNRFDTVEEAEFRPLNGVPAFYYQMALEKNQIQYKTYHVVQGNRVYVLSAGGSVGADLSDIDKFFSSFTPLPNQESVFNSRTYQGFTAQVPGEWSQWQDTTATDSLNRTFINFDSTDAVTYFVTKSVLPRYYSEKSDSGFFATYVKDGMPATDSILSERKVKLGNVTALQLDVHSAGMFNVNRMLMFANADTAYRVMAIIPKAERNAARYQRFFDSFRMNRTISSAYLQRKTKLLLDELRSKDSATAGKAREALYNYQFSEEDLPAMKSALLAFSPGDADSNNIASQLKRAIIKLGDSSIVSFVKSEYPRANGNGKLQYHMLDMLSAMHTRESYSLLKTLIVDQLPSSGGPEVMDGKLLDSVSLAATLFPEVLSKSQDSAFNEVLVFVLPALMDSGLVKKSTILPYEKDFLREAERLAAQPDSIDVLTWKTGAHIAFIDHMATPEAFATLKKLEGMSDVWTKKRAIESLVTAGQPVDPKAVELVAASLYFRSALYDSLAALGKEKLMPAMYLSPKSLGESVMYRYAVNDVDDEELKIEYVMERTENFKGAAHRFLLYKVTIETEDGPDVHLGVVERPAELKTIFRNEGPNGVHWSDNYDKSKVSQQLKAYLSEVEKRGSEDEG